MGLAAAISGLGTATPGNTEVDNGLCVTFVDSSGIKRQVWCDNKGRMIPNGNDTAGAAITSGINPIPMGLKDTAGNVQFLVGTTGGIQLINTEGQKATYSAAVNAHAPAATPTDWFTIQGSATKTVRILSLRMAFRATAANQYRASLIKYSVYLTGGTGAATTIVPHDSANGAATAVISTWAGGLPTPGTPVGKIADDSIPVSVLGTPVFNNEICLYDFGINNGQSIVLRGTAQYLAVNSGGAALPAGFVSDLRVVWTEE